MNEDAQAEQLSLPGWKSFASLMVIAVLIRFGVLLALPVNLDQDIDDYRMVAENVAKFGVFGTSAKRPVAYRPPLYPIVLAATADGDLVSRARVSLLHGLLGVATVAMVYWLGLSWKLGRWRWIAALLFCCDPIALHWSTFVMTETLATFLAAAGLLLLTLFGKQKTAATAALSGGALGVAILCRPTFLIWLAASALVALCLQATWRQRMLNGCVMLAVAAAVLVPWTIRNQRVFGRAIFATTHGGYTLLLGNNPRFYEFLRKNEAGVWDARELDWEQRRGNRNELEADRFAYELAWQNIRREPGMFCYACVVRAARLWSPLPNQPLHANRAGALVVLTAVWYALLYMLSLLGAWKLRDSLPRTPWLWGVMICLSFTGLHLFYWCNMRMRAPLMPVVCLAAAVGLRHLVACWKCYQQTRSDATTAEVGGN